MNEVKVLDKGFCRLVDQMGDDNRIVQSARVSYGQGTKTPSEDRDLIRYLMRMEHTSPFEQVIFVFHMKLPIFVARQIVRHRTSRLNEVSYRYSEAPEEYYIPERENIKKQSKKNKQGGGEVMDPDAADFIINEMNKTVEDCFDTYNWMLEEGISREMARTCLPVSVYTEWYFQMDLRNLFGFLKLRLDEHAQYETRQYAKAIYELIKPLVPVACEAFEDYILNANKFSAKEMEILRNYIKDLDNGWGINGDNDDGTLRNENFEKLSKRERTEFLDKLGIEK